MMARLFLFFTGLLLHSWAVGQVVPPLKVTPLAKDVYVHTSHGLYAGNAFPSNGLLIDTPDGVVLVDSGWDTLGSVDQTNQLLAWVKTHLKKPVRLCIVSHGHEDRVGGISALKQAGVRVISTPATAEKSARLGYDRPDAILPNDTTMTVGDVPIRCYFPGEGHTRDNIVVYLPTQRVLFGGCLVKSVAAFGMGNIADANMKQWGATIRHLQKQFPDVRFVVPGHQDWTDGRALNHTLTLLGKTGNH